MSDGRRASGPVQRTRGVVGVDPPKAPRPSTPESPRRRAPGCAGMRPSMGPPAELAPQCFPNTASLNCAGARAALAALERIPAATRRGSASASERAERFVLGRPRFRGACSKIAGCRNAPPDHPAVRISAASVAVNVHAEVAVMELLQTPPRRGPLVLRHHQAILEQLMELGETPPVAGPSGNPPRAHRDIGSAPALVAPHHGRRHASHTEDGVDAERLTGPSPDGAPDALVERAAAGPRRAALLQQRPSDFRWRVGSRGAPAGPGRAAFQARSRLGHDSADRTADGPPGAHLPARREPWS